MKSPLVEFLSNDDHPVELTRVRSDDELAYRIKCGQLLVRFTDTAGGTELKVRVSEAFRPELLVAAERKQPLQIQAECTLDEVPVRCVGLIDAGTLTGRARLIPQHATTRGAA
jgi:hypothetical protein